MTRPIRALLLIAALLFAQHAALLHGLEHARHEAAIASHGDDEGPALDHGRDVCAAFDALAHALPNAEVAPQWAAVPAISQSAAFAPADATTRIVFDSRAPPLSA